MHCGSATTWLYAFMDSPLHPRHERLSFFTGRGTCCLFILLQPATPPYAFYLRYCWFLRRVRTRAGFVCACIVACGTMPPPPPFPQHLCLPACEGTLDSAFLHGTGIVANPDYGWPCYFAVVPG